MSSNRLALLLVYVLGTSWSVAAFAQSEAANFSSIRQDILSNCYDCAGASESELRSAVAALERLVESGVTTVEARQLLADSYRQIALAYLGRNSPERAELLSRHREIYTELLNDYPDSLDILRAYALVAEDIDVADRLIAEATAAIAEANFIAGMLLFSPIASESELAIARDYLEQAFDTAVGPAKVAYGRRYADVLTQSGEIERAESVLKEIREYREESGL